MRGAGGGGGRRLLSQSDGVLGEEDYCPNLTGCGVRGGGGGEDYCPNLTGCGGEEDVSRGGGGEGEREGFCPNCGWPWGRRLLFQSEGGGGGGGRNYDPEKMLLTGQAFSCWVRN